MRPEQEQAQESASAPQPEAQNEVQEPFTDMETDIEQEASAAAEAGEDLRAKYQELHDQHLRLAADFENFRKRVLQEREALLKYGAANTIEQLLPILDNLDRASSSLSEKSDPKMLYQSFQLLTRQLLDGLASQGLKKIETIGQPFDPNFHEAAGQVETDDQPENTIVTEVQRGFMLHDRVLRPALVMVAVATPSHPQASQDQASNPFAQATENDSL